MHSGLIAKALADARAFIVGRNPNWKPLYRRQCSGCGGRIYTKPVPGEDFDFVRYACTCEDRVHGDFPGGPPATQRGPVDDSWTAVTTYRHHEKVARVVDAIDAALAQLEQDAAKQAQAAIDIEPIRARLAAATPGPWEWFGNTKTYQCHLSTVHGGRRHVMNFWRWGMSQAQPSFQVSLGPPVQVGSGYMVKLSEMAAECPSLGPKFEVEYRRDFVGIGHPDAELIARAPTDIAALLAEVDRLRSAGATVAAGQDDGQDTSATASDEKRWVRGYACVAEATEPYSFMSGDVP